MVERKYNTFRKKYHCQWTFLRGKKPKWIFHNLVPICYNHWNQYQASRERVVTTEWLTSFLAHMSLQEEAALATNWIKDRPEGLKLQNLALATMAIPVMSSLPKKLTADVQYAINKCESLGTGQQMILHGNPSAITRNFSPHMAVLRRHVLPNMHYQFCMLLQGTLGGDFDIFASSGESTAWVLLWKIRFKTNWREGLSCSPNPFFQHRI